MENRPCVIYLLWKTHGSSIHIYIYMYIVCVLLICERVNPRLDVLNWDDPHGYRKPIATLERSHLFKEFPVCFRCWQILHHGCPISPQNPQSTQNSSNQSLLFLFLQVPVRVLPHAMALGLPALYVPGLTVSGGFFRKHGQIFHSFA